MKRWGWRDTGTWNRATASGMRGGGGGQAAGFRTHRAEAQQDGECGTHEA